MEKAPEKLVEEMNRFEAEIANPNAETPNPNRPIIGANTFSTVQKKLEDARPLFPPPPSIFPGGSGQHSSVAFSGIPPPPPPPAFLFPHQIKGRSYYDSRPGPVVVAAAPTKYAMSHAVNTRIDEEVSEFLTEIKKDEEELERQKKTLAKLMADRVKASTIISFQSMSYEERRRKNKKLMRLAGGQAWEDPSLAEWDENDYRIFCGDLGNDVTDDVLTRAFSKYPSFMKAKVVRDKRTNKTKGFGFVSFKDPQDFIKAMKEMNGRYVGSRPIKLRKSTWRARSMDVVKKKDKEKATLISILTGKAK